MSTNRPAWLQATIDRWGEPTVAPLAPGEKTNRGRQATDKGIFLGGSTGWRRAWVWFPGGVNHAISIDANGSRATWVVRATGPNGVEAAFRTNGDEPSSEQVAAVLALAWSTADPKES